MPRIEFPPQYGNRGLPNGHPPWGYTLGLAERLGGHQSAVLHESWRHCVRSGAKGGPAGLDQSADLGCPRESKRQASKRVVTLLRLAAPSSDSNSVIGADSSGIRSSA